MGEPINVDPPTPDELANASNKLGCGGSTPKPEPTRQEQAYALRPQLQVLLDEVMSHLVANRLSKAYVALDRARTMEMRIYELERFKTAEEHRLFLIRQAENGYH